MGEKILGVRKKAFEDLLVDFYFNLDKVQRKEADKRLKKLKVPVVSIEELEQWILKKMKKVPAPRALDSEYYYWNGYVQALRAIRIIINKKTIKEGEVKGK